MRTNFNELRLALLAAGPGSIPHVPTLLGVCRPGAENFSQRTDEPQTDPGDAARKARTGKSDLLPTALVQPNG